MNKFEINLKIGNQKAVFTISGNRKAMEFFEDLEENIDKEASSDNVEIWLEMVRDDRGPEDGE